MRDPNKEEEKLFLNMIRARGYKTFFMLNSVEHEILNVYKYRISRNSAFFRLR